MNIDQVNACMETVLAANVWLGVRKLRKDRTVTGFFWPTAAFWALFGAWSLVFYWAEGYRWSVVPAGAVVLGNMVWFLHAALLSWTGGAETKMRVRNLRDL